MAEPVSYQPDQDPKQRLLARLEAAPAEHAEALLAAYDLLQLLHQRGILDLLAALLRAGDDLSAKLLEQLTQAPNLRALRNLVVLAQSLTQMDPDLLRVTATAVRTGLQEGLFSAPSRASLWALARRIARPASRRVLWVLADTLEEVGRRWQRP
jgi:uncharacterized protein YjgD (DUF1641 family)